jgi:hypothetical protein
VISRTGKYWSTGITIRYRAPSNDRPAMWGAALDYYDDGFAGDDDPAAQRISTEGTLRTRYLVEDAEDTFTLAVVLDVLIADAAALGIALRGPSGDPPCLYVKGDGEHDDVELPDDWREILREQAERIGWATYGYQPTLYCWALWDEHWQELVSMTSGYLLRTADDAIQELAEGAGDLAWMREHNRVERITEERWGALDRWDELTEDEKAALRPQASKAGA